MSIKRRDFIRTASILGSGLALTAFRNPWMHSDIYAPSEKLKAFGLQLYTVRNDMAKDPKGVLKDVAAAGYKQIEGFEGAKGIFWGMTNKEFKSYLDSLGLVMISSHCNINQDFERKAQEAGEIGMKYLICPHFGPHSIEEFKKEADLFNQCGATCKKNGMRFAYHNHDYSFKPVDGQLPQDVMMQNTDPSLVDFEMDMYWVVTAGQDPIAWLDKYPNRFRLCHVKDRQKEAPASQTAAFAILGTGKIDYPKILKVAENKGVKYFIVEQDQTYNIPPLEAIKENADYLKKMTI